MVPNALFYIMSFWLSYWLLMQNINGRAIICLSGLNSTFRLLNVVMALLLCTNCSLHWPCFDLYKVRLQDYWIQNCVARTKLEKSKKQSHQISVLFATMSSHRHCMKNYSFGRTAVSPQRILDAEYSEKVFKVVFSACILDPNEDMFAKRMKVKKEKIAKNELQRLRNIARNMKGKGIVSDSFHVLCLLILCESNFSSAL